MPRMSHPRLLPRTAAVLLALVSASRALAAETQPVNPLLRTAGIHQGLCVTVGIDDADTLAALTNNGRMLVHAHVRDAATRDALRLAMDQRSLLGLVVVDALPAGAKVSLPYSENFANLVICDPAQAAAVSREELVRVTAPFGVTMIRSDSQWTATPKPRPTTLDDWPSWLGKQDQNPVNNDRVAGPPTMPRWLVNNDEGFGVGMRIDGPLALHFVQSGEGRETSYRMVVRSAFNGVPISVVSTKETPSREIVLSNGQFLYRPDGMTGPAALFNAWTGEKITDLDPAITAAPATEDKMQKVAVLRAMAAFNRAIPLAKGGYVVGTQGRVAVFDVDGKLRIKVAAANQYLPVVANDLLVTVEAEPVNGPFGDLNLKLSAIRAFRLADGAPVWTCNEVKDWYLRRFYGYANGAITFTWYDAENAAKWHPRLNGLAAIDVATGKLLWKKDKAVKGVTWDTAIRGDRVWFIAVSGGRVYDLKTGANEQPIGFPQWNCQEGRATPEWYLAGMTFIKPDGTNIAKGLTRASCNVGEFPANGLVYSNATNCSCLDQWIGHGAFAAEAAPTLTPDAERLQKGPAYAADSGKNFVLSAKDWPTWQHDAKRTAATATTIPDKPELLWQTRLAAANCPQSPITTEWFKATAFVPQISQATVADGLVCVSLPTEHKLVTLDAKNGAPKWSFIASGRIDAPPTIAGGSVFFGCRDGWVYALDASSGQLRWRYLAAPNDRRIVVDGHVESPWPVFAPVLLLDGALYASAGLHSQTLPGLTMVRLDPATGQAAWRSTYYSGDTRSDPANGGKSYLKTFWETTNDVLVESQGLICLGRLAFDPTTGHHGPIARTNTRFDERGCIATIDGRQIRLARLYSGRGGLLSATPTRNGTARTAGAVTYDGQCARHMAIDLANKRLYALHGAKSRTSGGLKTGGPGLQAFPLDDLNGIVGQDRGLNVNAPVNAWTVLMADGKDRSPARLGLLLAGDKLIVPGRDDYRQGWDKRRHVVIAYSPKDGSTLSEFALPSPPTLNGVSAADGRLFITLEDGSIACYGIR